MMSYSGTIGPPGSYYVKIADMRDTDGRHPGETAQTDPSETSAQAAEPGTAAAPASDRLAQTGADSAAAPPISNPAAAPPAPGRSIDALIASAASRPLPFDGAPRKHTPDENTEISARLWMPVASLAVLIAALGGFALLRRRHGTPENHAAALEIARDEVHAQASALRRAKSDTMLPDRYGTTHSDGWEREKALFVNSRIFARLRDAGYADTLPALLPAIDTEIERQANSMVESGTFAPDTGPVQAYGIVARDNDPELSTYATRCESLLREAGWTTELSPAETGQGIDILAERGGRKLLLQCKGGRASVGVEAVQRAFASCARRHADVAAIVTHASFTRAAQQLASANGVHALRDDGLNQLIQ